MNEFERGRKEGKTDATLEEHEAHLGKINGSIDRFAQAVESLSLTVGEKLRDLASEIRTLQEEGRLAEERVRVAAETLEVETERRRKTLAETAATSEAAASIDERKFSKRERVVGLLITVALALIGFYIATHYH